MYRTTFCPPHLARAAKRHRMWLLRWVAGATAHTDTPQSLVALIKQRRRWLNGSLFALIYYLQHFPRIVAANHSVPRKAALCLQWVFQLTTAAFAWTAGGLREGPRALGPRFGSRGAPLLTHRVCCSLQHVLDAPVSRPVLPSWSTHA